MELHEFQEASKERLLQLFKHEIRLGKVLPGNWTLPVGIDLKKIKEFQIYEDDVWVVTTPKSGTTWMQELAWLIMHDVNFEKSSNEQFFRFPFLEIEYLLTAYPITEETATKFAEYPNTPCNIQSSMWYKRHSMEYAGKMARPRMIKSHLPLSLLPDNLLETCKVIYVTRNMKDAAVSYYYHFRNEIGVKQSFEKFANCYIKDEIIYTPYIQHILNAWEKRNHPNMFFTTYEAMKKDIKNVAVELISFLRGSSYIISDENMKNLLAAVDLESFRRNKFVNKTHYFKTDENGYSFIRKGVIGDWKNHFDKDMNKEWDSEIERQLSGSDFRMVFE